VLQILYQFDLHPDRDTSGDERFLQGRLHNHPDLVAFSKQLIQGVMRNREELDQQLAQRAENWSLDRMAATDRNVLRLGAFELLFTETPGRVVINEAVELARRFGTAQSSQFVNGVLDGFLKDGPHGGEESPSPSKE
jgi:N utilization substance protein B